MVGRRATVTLFLVCLGAATSLRAGTSPNLVLITLDTLRADHLSCNGSDKVQTPNLDRLAREGANFTRARSPVPLTLPAHASILTGNYPPTHTVRSNGEYRLPRQQVSLAEVLQGEGYRTAAFVASFVLDRRFGLNQGFDLYDDRVWSNVDELEELEAERTGGEVFSVFAEWLDREDGTAPFFVWIHLYDPHAPYDPPEPYRSQYREDPYSGEIAYTDSVVGKIVSELENRDRLSNTLLAVTGDHGEGLGEHGETTHSLLIYNSTLHVPMMIWAPGVVAGGRTIDNLVRIIDLAPTILDYLGMREGLGEGVSLRSMIDNPAKDDAGDIADLTAYSESYYPELALGWSPLRGLESTQHRFILAPKPLLFNMTEDPGETLSVVDSESTTYQRLKYQLMESIRRFDVRSGPTESPSLDSESRTRLESLGYLASSGKTSGRRGPQPDPNQNVELWARIQRGIGQVGAQDYSQAIDAFETVLVEDPDIPLIYEYLGTCWRKLGDDVQAERVYRQALGRGIESPRLHSELGRILLQRGETALAERELQVAVTLDPQSVVTHYDLGNLYRRKREYPLAIEHYEAALEINPSYLWSWNGLAMSLSALNQDDRALEAFRRVVEIEPRGAAGFYNLALHLERVGQGPEARRVYEEFLDLAEGEEFDAQRRQAREAIERLSN